MPRHNHVTLSNGDLQCPLKKFTHMGPPPPTNLVTRLSLCYGLCLGVFICCWDLSSSSSGSSLPSSHASDNMAEVFPLELSSCFI